MRILSIFKKTLPFRCYQDEFYRGTLREAEPEFCEAFSLGRFRRTLDRLNSKWFAAKIRRELREEKNEINS